MGDLAKSGVMMACTVIMVVMLLLADIGESSRTIPSLLLRRHSMKKQAQEVHIAEVVHPKRRHLQTGSFCVASSGADQTKLQDALDWACGTGTGNGNVDCSAILQTGSCYSPNSLQAHASYAFNYYYVKQNGASGSCDFGGLATVTTTDPSSGSCTYPSVGGTTGSTTSTSPTTTTSGSTNATIFSPTPTSNSTAFGTTTGSTSAAVFDLSRTTTTAFLLAAASLFLAVSWLP